VLWCPRESNHRATTNIQNAKFSTFSTKQLGPPGGEIKKPKVSPCKLYVHSIPKSKDFFAEAQNAWKPTSFSQMYQIGSDFKIITF
jgi:hypothetical protein